jgi:NADPH:quinone reductase-like Zn-dependent oxidoreductase
MRAIQFKKFGIENLELVDCQTPEPGELEVLVKTKAAALQYLDLIVVDGTVAPDLALPHIPVSEGMGIVERVGKGVTRWKTGDRVLIPFISRWEAGKITPYSNELRTGMQLPGTLAEYSVQPENTLVRAPNNLTDEEAASLPVAGLTAWAALVSQANIKAGQTILIQGSGGVSLFALQIAKAFGLRIIATTGSKEKEAKLRALGAIKVINYKETPEWSQEVLLFNNGGVDVTLDVGGTQSIRQSILACKLNGFIGLTGFLSGGKLEIDVFPLIMNYIRLQGYSVGNSEELAELVKAIEIKNIKPVIDSVFALEETQSAFKRLESGLSFGKIIIKF